MSRSFLPDEAQPADGLAVGPRYRLEPLRTEHNALDHRAVMEAASDLRIRTANRWPTVDFSAEENRADLAMHQGEHERREAFTYTVLGPAGSPCFGCVYIDPVERLFARWGGPPPPGFPSDPHVAGVTYWVTPTERASGGDRALVEALRRWFEREWAFSRVYFVTTRGESWQVELFESLGMSESFRLDQETERLTQLFFEIRVGVPRPD